MLLEKAILETLAYSDIFDYPLTIAELHRYLVIPATQAELAACIMAMNTVESKDGYYFLKGRSEIADIRKARLAESQKPFKRAVFYGKMLGMIPFVRMAAMTGSLAVLNLSKSADMDFMLVTRPKRLWLARAMAVVFGRIMRIFGDKICVNLLVSENALAWPVHDLYSAREMCQMIPISGFATYQRLRAANLWVSDILPNTDVDVKSGSSTLQKQVSVLQNFLEFILFDSLADLLENRLMNFQRHHINRTYGKGMETNFSADVCQGNFHDHRKWADTFFHERLSSLGLKNESTP